MTSRDSWGGPMLRERSRWLGIAEAIGMFAETPLLHPSQSADAWFALANRIEAECRPRWFARRNRDVIITLTGTEREIVWRAESLLP